MIKIIKRTFLLILFCVFFVCSNKVKAAELNEEFTNIVIFVDFSDTVSHCHEEALDSNACFRKIGNGDVTFGLFNGTDHEGNVTDKRGLAPYISNVSYGQLSVNNIFPQYDENTNTIEPYVLDNTLIYYKERPYELVQDLMNKLDEDTDGKNRIGNQRLSHIENGKLDNLIIVTSWSGKCSKDPMGGVTYRLGGGSFTSNSGITYTVDSFNIIPECRAFLGIQGSGVIIHEFMHSIGYPDLYCNPGSNGKTSVPVGYWDIMSSVSFKVQYPLAYMRQYISGWLQLNTITTNQLGYSLVAASSTDESNKNQQAVILKTPYSDTEFFVVEYRKKMDEYTSGGSYSKDYETCLPATGLIIYRVDTKQSTNITGAPYLVYVFRPGDSVGESGYENAYKGAPSLKEACMSEETGITFYGSADPSDSLEDCAITYSDGTNSGIVIKNIGSSSGDIISFDIEFNNMSQDDYWTIVADGKTSDYTQEISSFMDENGELYCISSSGGNSDLLKNVDGNWIKIVSVPSGYSYSLTKYNGKFYVSYLNNNGYLSLISYASNQWESVYTSNVKVTEYSMQLGNQGIDMVFNGELYSGVYNYHYYNDGGILKIVESPSSKWYANPQIAFLNEIPYVIYRDVFNSNKIVLKRLKNGIWEEVPIDFYSDAFWLNGNVNNIYLTLNEDDGVVVYCLASDEESNWEKLGNGALCTENLSSCDFTFLSGKPYIALSYGTYAEVLTLQDNTWKRVGNKCSLSTINDVSLYNNNNYLLIMYRDALNYSTVIKKYCVVSQGSSGENPKPLDPNPNTPPFVTPDVETQIQAMYRLYNPNSGEHFYTAVISEKNHLVNVGWKYEGIAWYAPITGDPVYRLYNPNAGDHHYTTSKEEKNHLVEVGWNYEGIAWYSGGNIPLYRAYNPNATAGAHHYTISRTEINHIVSVGWRDEGIGWYGVK